MTLETLVWLLVIVAAVIAAWDAFGLFFGEDIRSSKDESWRDWPQS